ncbi:MAG: helix-turn-helix domain-containing protein [Leptolyngbya sp. SIOISBB]|nr:helix-turn-helix domain-containing protein [Leptolyngbya sp. SIOISBB]
MPSDRAASSVTSQGSATERLRALMTAVDIPSFRALARQAQVSDWAVQQLRSDRITAMRVERLQKIAAALNLSLPELLGQFGVMTAGQSPAQPAAETSVVTLKAEYQRLQTQLEQQETVLQQQFQTAALAVLESWLVQWPTVTHAVEKNPDLPASRLVPLVQPIQTLLEQWEVEVIAAVGATVPYDPQVHQLMTGDVEPGVPVRVRYTGFRQRGKLLHRAKVSPVEG